MVASNMVAFIFASVSLFVFYYGGRHSVKFQVSFPLIHTAQTMSEITRLLDAAAGGDRQAANDLLPLVYDELRKLAAAKMAREKPGQTLNATALVHEAYLRLVGDQQFDGRRHFFAAAAEAMRRILVDNARRKNLPKHGGGRQRIELHEAHRILESSDDLLLLNDALEMLVTEDSVAAEIVKLRLFAGLSVDEAGDALGLARATTYRHWSFARAWLRCEVGEQHVE
jgi:RNA polymerase sigma factor (TIGR02999 family)